MIFWCAWSPASIALSQVNFTVKVWCFLKITPNNLSEVRSYFKSREMQYVQYKLSGLDINIAYADRETQMLICKQTELQPGTGAIELLW